MKRLIVLLVIIVLAGLAWEGISKFIPQVQKNVDFKLPSNSSEGNLNVKIEENFVINVVKKSEASVITIGVENPPPSQGQPDPFDFFFERQPQIPEKEKRDRFIGSGFVIQKDGLIVTNKHVVGDPDFDYIVIDNKGNKYKVGNIYRDPLNDIAIIKVANPPRGGFDELAMGDSSKLQVGQFVVAIGTPLGEFTNTVTFGVISGLGRGVDAGSPFQGFVERLDNVIQTDAAINPGNSGGPLLNSSGQVIGVNTAISGQAQNIGFAIPINTVKASVSNFNETGQFNRPFLGVSYSMVSEEAARLNDVPEGALVREVVQDSTAARAGLEPGDIITKLDGQTLQDDNGGLAAVISKKKVGDTVTIVFFRDGETQEKEVTLEAAPEE